MTNVVEFPKRFANKNTSIDDELDELIEEETKRRLSDQFAEKHWARLLKQFILSGSDIDGEDFFPSAILVLESIRSLHLQSQGLHHPLQDFARDSINIEDIEEYEKETVDNDEDMD